MKYYLLEQFYTQFSQDWKAAVKSERSKSKTITVQTHVTRCNSIIEYTHRTPGWLTGAHHVLYNIVHDRPLNYGFNETTNITKLKNSGFRCLGFYKAMYKLHRIKIDIAIILKKQATPGYQFELCPKLSKDVVERRVSIFIEPLNNSLTLDILYTMIDIPNIKTVLDEYFIPMEDRPSL